jgi:hypothetical protein
VTDDQATGTDEQKPDEQEERQGDAAAGGEDDEVAKARKASEQEDEAVETVKKLEEDPPEKLEDWPDDKAKYQTFGGAEGEESYEESVTSKLGPSSLRHRDDGSVEIEGEKVDDPEQYKGDPIPGGPTDPAISDSRAYGEPDLTDETSVDVEGKGKGDDSDADDSDKDDSGADDSEERQQSEQKSE